MAWWEGIFSSITPSQLTVLDIMQYYTHFYIAQSVLIKIGYIEILCKIKYYKSSEEDNFIDSSISPKAKIRTWTGFPHISHAMSDHTPPQNYMLSVSVRAIYSKPAITCILDHSSR